MKKFLFRALVTLALASVPFVDFAQNYGFGNPLFFDSNTLNNPNGLSANANSPKSLIDVGDIDADGDIDIVRCPEEFGTVNMDFFINDGSNNFTTINASNYNLNLVTSIGSAEYYMCPTLGDLDGDLDLDILLIGGAGTTLYYCENIGTPAIPSFAVPVTAPFGIATPGISSIQLIDLNGDGLLDIVGGSSAFGHHNWLYYQNIGSPSAPAFAAPSTNPFGLEVEWSTDFYFGDPVYLNFYDYDSDGDYDLTYSNINNVLYQENIGTATNPLFFTSYFQFNWGGRGNYQYFQWDADPEIEMIATANNGDFTIFNTVTMSITQQPVDVTVCDGQYTSIYVTASNVVSYYWQVYYPGIGWTAAPNDWFHSGQYTNAFYFSPATSSDNNTSYRCLLTDLVGNQVISDSVHITVQSYQNWYLDSDGDGFGDYNSSVYTCNAPAANYVANASDCDDTNPSITLPPGNPSVFPVGEWNIYGFNGTYREAYRGYYTHQGLTYNSSLDYDPITSPSAAATWQGCDVTNNYFSLSVKRHGFQNNGLPYAIRLDSWDDVVYVYVNGSYVASVGCCGNGLVAWTGYLDANSEVEFYSVEYSELQNLAFSIYEITPLVLNYSGSSFQTTYSCGQLGVSLNPTSNLGYSSQNITYTATVDDPTIVNPNITYVDNWWGTTSVYFNMGGNTGTTILHVIGTDPAGNSDTLDFTITSTPCPPTLISTSVNTYCGVMTDTTTFMVFDTPVADTYTVQSLYSLNQNAILDADVHLVSTFPVDSTFSNGITFHGTAFVVSYTYSGPDTWSYIFLELQNSSGNSYQTYSTVQRIIDYSTPTILADFISINLDASAETCTAQADWVVTNALPPSYFGTNSDYITNFTSSGIFYLAANSPLGVTRFGLNGNAGADGNGHVDSGSQTYTAPSGRSYIIFYEMAQEYSSDPGINTILIVEGSETSATLTADYWLSNATAVLEGLTGSGKVMFAATIGSTPVGWNGGSTSVYSSATMIAVGERFADAIDATRTAAAGNPMDLSLIDASMQVETAFMTSTMLTDFYALNPYPSNDLVTNALGQVIGISDGGYDMYDGGNYIVTNYNDYYGMGNSGIPYTNGVVTLGGPTGGTLVSTIAVMDDCPVSLTFSHASGSQFPIGTTQVVATAQDSSGNSTSFTFDVVVTGNPQSYYVDADLDGFGTGSLVQLCQIPTSGYTLNNADCDDSNAAVNPSASEICNSIDDDCDGLADDGLAFTNYYLDTDADGFGAGAPFNLCANPGAGYALTNTDCINTNANAHPGASEVCGNNVDEDCNGIADNGCFVSGIGENPSNAISCTTSMWPNCSSVSGTLTGAASSSSAQTLCLTGEDKWYQFVATTEAASIVVNSTSNDIVVELQTAAGALVGAENSVLGLGGEILTVSGLTAGQLYKLGIRNYNSANGIGQFSVCVRMLKRGGCDYGAGPYSLCNYFKATWAGASGTSYRYTFTGLTGPAAGNVYTRTQSTDICVLSNVTPTLPYGSTYNLLITNIYTVNNAAGVPVVVEVPALSPCTLATIAEPITALRVADQCSTTPKFRGAIVQSAPWICGITNWRWRFTEVNAVTYATVGIPFEVNRGAASNYLNLGTVAQLQYGKTYAVQTAPLFSYTGSNYNWGPISYMCIVGSAGMIENPSEQPNQRLVETDQPNLLVYPNPTEGNFVLNISGISTNQAEIRIYDALGRQMYNNRVSVEGMYVANVNLSDVSNGLYMVEVIYNGKSLTQRIMIQK